MFFEPYKAEPNAQPLLKFPDECLTPNSSKHDYSSIICGINSKGVDYIRELLKSSFRVNHHFGPFKETLLHVSVTLGRLDCVEYLYENRANVNSKNKYNQTPLHYAIDNSFIEIAVFLIAYGADITIKDINEHTPEDIARKSYDVDPKLIEEGFEIIHCLTNVKISEVVTNHPEASDESDGDDESYYDELCSELLNRIMHAEDIYKSFLF